MVFRPKMAIFPNFFFGTIGQENVFYDILKRKNTFLGYKNKKFKNSKNLTFFQRRYTMVLLQKRPFFQHFLLRQYRPGKCLLRYFTMEKRLSGQKKTKSPKGRKIDIFQKELTHGFGPKMAIFPIFFFRHYTPGKCLLRYSRTKKRLSRL